ncbi:sugar ABC transporter substrate-binding protein [Niallia nealsonii]|uniref:Sugar ABC transporter substrate-binding protein n=1 Tax=Niallia nealsonii TaxID=115979 RepID=A0A2N0YYH9_9BACI|nr:sugar ABC transporter substrate-binding protein [Niallia nealsonii]PKG22317.1 sugar ABC transporter substrate-binding protein [Niallia nealsonii]
MKKKWFILLICLVFLGGLCSYIIIEKKQKKPKIAVVLKGTKSDYWKIIVAGIERAFDNYGVEGKFLASDNTKMNQIDILKKVLKEKPDALIFSPEDAKLPIPILKEYEKHNIPVLLVDTNLDWSGKTSFIGTNNDLLGQKAGELLSSMSQPNDKILIIGYISNDYVSEDRIQGAKKALNNAGIHMVIKQFELNKDIAPVIPEILQANSKVKGIFATDDGAALKIMKVLEEKNLNIPVVGADGIIKMVKKIENGTIRATIAQNPYDMGYISGENALKAIKGEQVKKEIDSDVDIITIDNAQSKRTFLENLLEN